ncbi:MULTISPECIES: hypothetical protein [unclassified Pseudonocardia]|uniref:hypothetical protein n=1 Tax=unclassified Pseudonocardia TaxID=2619320 RepID=UPI000A859161|nr:MULTISPECIES: hypothetical protein [unclassified Pseudonocardia]
MKTPLKWLTGTLLRAAALDPAVPVRVHAVLRDALGRAERLELVPRNVAKLVRVKTPEYSVGKGLPVDRSNRAR